LGTPWKHLGQIASAAGGLGSAVWSLSALLISLLPNLGVRARNFLGLVAIVFMTLYIFIVRGWGDFFVRNTQIA
jgi:hypothetical protein